MNYLALGDSISIDDYTGVVGGGAASQFARLIGAAKFLNLTRDGCTTDGVLDSLDGITIAPDVITMTAGGNDFLLAAFCGADPNTKEGWNELVNRPVGNLKNIVERLSEFQCPVILNTIYDPTDGDDSVGGTLGISATYRSAYLELNNAIRALARRPRFLLSDLHAIFAGHGIQSSETWIVGEIEPNFGGAAAIARNWFEIVSKAQLAPIDETDLGAAN